MTTAIKRITIEVKKTIHVSKTHGTEFYLYSVCLKPPVNNFCIKFGNETIT